MNIAVTPRGNTHIARKRAPKNLIESVFPRAFFVEVYIVSALSIANSDDLCGIEILYNSLVISGIILSVVPLWKSTKCNRMSTRLF